MKSYHIFILIYHLHFFLGEAKGSRPGKKPPNGKKKKTVAEISINIAKYNDMYLEFSYQTYCVKEN